jgi:hypothetical protein
MRLLCFFGAHRRSRSDARWTGSTYESWCQHCGVPMEKPRNGRWRRAVRVKRDNLPRS